MNENPSYLVYKHLTRFLSCRGLVPVKADEVAHDRPKFVDLITHFGYFRVDTVDEQDRRTVIMVLAPGTFTEQGPRLHKLIHSLSDEGFAHEGRLHEVIIIVPEDVIDKKNITDVVLSLRGAAESSTKATYYNMYPYSVFSVDIPNVRAIPPHSIAAAADVGKFLTRERLQITDLPRIGSDSPPVVWIGARPGQVVQVRQSSETAGEAVVYLLVKA